MTTSKTINVEAVRAAATHVEKLCKSLETLNEVVQKEDVPHEVLQSYIQRATDASDQLDFIMRGVNSHLFALGTGKK